MNPAYINGDTCTVMLGYPDDETTVEPIRYVVADCSLGDVLLAASHKGVVSILMGNDRSLLESRLRGRFSKADIQRGDWREEELLLRMIHFVENPSIGLALPLDVRGTPFQHKVWEFVREIPMGRTATVAAIARRFGTAQVLQSVYDACSENDLAVAVPCHRVVHDRQFVSASFDLSPDQQHILIEREREAYAKLHPAKNAD